MTHCIIHIGMHKTGSSSIQTSLHGFADDRFFYAPLGDDPNHSVAIYSLFSSDPEKHHIHQASGRDPAALSAYIARMKACLEHAISEAGERTVLISGEDISALPADALLRLKQYFEKRIDRTTIVGYVRPPAAFMASAFQQRVKGGAVTHFRPDGLYRSYRARFARFDEVFGRDNVQLWKFDPRAFPGECAVQDFCSRLGVKLSPKRIVRLNESLPRQVVALLFTYQKLAQDLGFTAIRGPEGQMLGELLSAVGKDRFRFSPDLMRNVLMKSRADIQWMETRLGQPLTEELGEHQPGDVQAETDLLHHDPAVIRKLLRLLGRSAPAGVKGANPEEVARLVHAFREKHAAT